MGGDGPTDELYGADPRDFVAARDRAAKTLKAEGRGDDAAQVKRLRRPSVAAWALNQVARHHPAAVADLLTTVERARSAQDEVLAGGDRESLRTALAERRHALHTIVDAARTVIEDSGRSPDAATRDIESFLQGALDDTTIEAVRRGELTDLARRDEAGGGDELSALLAASVREPAEPSASAASDARRKKLAEEVSRHEDEVREAAARVSQSNELVAQRERELREARRALDDAERAHHKALDALERARTELDAAE